VLSRIKPPPAERSISSGRAGRRAARSGRNVSIPIAFRFIEGLGGVRPNSGTRSGTGSSPSAEALGATANARASRAGRAGFGSHPAWRDSRRRPDALAQHVRRRRFPACSAGSHASKRGALRLIHDLLAGIALRSPDGANADDTADARPAAERRGRLKS